MKNIKLIALCIVTVLCFSIIASAEAPKFTDVPESAWYYTDVMNAVDLGLISGKTTTTYCPDNNLTYAEAMKLAACMHQLSYLGKITLKVGDPWYVEYVNYCEEVGIARKSYPLDSNATRAGYMELFANALPDDRLPVINYVPTGSIPDVPENAGYAAAVYKLYRAGIVGGVDAKRNCNPGANIKRSEVAAILSRMMDETKRVRFDIGTPEKTDPLVITAHPQSITLEKAEKVTATVAASGGKAPYTYLWELAIDEYWYSADLLIWLEPEVSTMLIGYTTDTITFNFPGDADGGAAIRCRVTDALGNSVISDMAMLFIKGEDKEEPKVEETETPKVEETEPPKTEEPTPENTFAFVTELPETTHIVVGDDITLEVKVTGGKEPYTYQWYHGEFVIPTKTYTKSPKFENAAKVSFTVLPEFVPPSDNVQSTFSCEVTDADGNKLNTSTGIKDTTPNDMPLTIVKQPYRLTKPVYAAALTLDIEVYGGKKPYSYEWHYYTGYRNQTAKITGSNGVRFFDSELSLSMYPENDKLNSKIYCVVTDAAGNSVTSDTIVPCEDFLMMNFESKTEVNGSTVIVARMASGVLRKGDKIAILNAYDSETGNRYFATATVQKIEMFDKEYDVAAGHDRVAITLSGVKEFATREEIAPFVSESENKASNVVFAQLAGALSISCDRDYVAKAKGNPVALTFTVSGGDTVEKVVLEKFVDGKWEFVENVQEKPAYTYVALGKNIENLGDKGIYRAVVTDKKGTTAISNEVTVEMLNFRFVSMPEETITAKSGTPLILSVKAEGGVEPYTYQWYEWRKETNGFSLFPLNGYNTSTVLYEGAKTDTLTFKVQSYLVNNTQKGILCKVTDAEGNEIKTNKILIKN